MTIHDAGEEYRGPATIRVDDTTVEVDVYLRGHFEPIDGTFHWYGRLAPEATQEFRSGSHAELTTPHATASGRLDDVDAWGRLRIRGTGRPPF